MMRGFNIVILLLFNIFCYVICNIYNVVCPPSPCFKAYVDGGASAVFGSTNCNKWILGSQILRNKMENCNFATIQGHRDYQEDRVVCDLDMKLGFLLGEEVTLSIAAIFDGHGGSEVSELASMKFLDYFQVNALFNAYQHGLYLDQESEEADRHNSTLQRSLVKVDDKSLHDILEEALRRTFKDIDSEFSVESANKKSVAGSTGIVIILLNDELLIGHLGDSRALLCSKGSQSHHQGLPLELYAEQLTVDHHPDRAEEKARIERAGGFVTVWGVPRVNGILAISRALGDVFLKKYGVIAEPEIIGWRTLTAQERHLVIASDGIFESMTLQHVCDLMASADILGKMASKTMYSCSSSSSLPDCIVNTAFRRGSTDNLSAIVILLRLDSLSQQDVENFDKSEL
ncbi:hypothetical protein Leryth_004709 [Lithospermum erythrorhizon]|nr:hypothetical protein Leryth_004709 [Lithospermum erythrorhizon]